MKFTCDRCNAQYMISDEKVGPAGVKVRCKKCGNVVAVRRVAEQPQAAPAPAAPAGGGLDVELGQAFDSAFGDAPASGAAPGSDAGPAQPGADQPRPDDEPAPAPAPTEWYVAIGQAQVGPLPLADVKRKWEAGDIGPDSLVWRPGMADWQPLSAVPELAGYLAPVPRAAAQPSRSEPRPAREKPSGAPAPAADVTWKPAGASALAALASEEIAARSEPETKPAAVSTGVKSLVDGLPDGGGVDPTGAIPLPMKALETTGEKKLERRSTIAHRAEEARHRRSVTRAVVVGVLVIAIVAGAAGGALWYVNRKLPAPAGAVATAPTPAPAQPAPAPSAPDPAVAAAPPAPPAAAEPAPAEAAPADAATPPPAAAVEPAPPSRPATTKPARVARRETTSRQPTAPRASAEPKASAPPPAPTPSPAPARKKDSLLDFGSNDSALDEALGGGGGGTGRSVYVPPARSGTALPASLSPAQINEAVAGRIDSLRRCVSEQKQRDPSASGVLKMRWIIAGDGGVRDVKCLTPEYAKEPFAQCISGVVKTIKFPRSATTGQEVTFPFSF